MNSTLAPQTFRNRDRDATPVSSFNRAEDILEAMLRSIEGGELHLRPTLDAGEGDPFLNYIEIGFALRQCLEDKSQREYLIQRLKPHVSVIIGTLPAGIQSHGLLPRTLKESPQETKFRRLEDIPDEEVRQWLIVDGGLIYGELKRYELENYFDVIGPLVHPGGIMYDLGSGLGKAVMSAAITLPFARCIGVELLEYRHRMAVDRLQVMLATGDRGLESLPVRLQPDDPLELPGGSLTTARHLLDIRSRIEFVEKDMFEVDVSDASLVFMNSTCFGSFMHLIADKLARELREKTLVSTTTYSFNHPAFKLIACFPAATLAWTDLFLYERVHCTETQSHPEIAALFEPGDQEWEARVREEFLAIDARMDREGKPSR